MPRRCVSSNCDRYAGYGKLGGKPKLCGEHAKEDMVMSEQKVWPQRVHDAAVVRQDWGEAGVLR